MRKKDLLPCPFCGGPAVFEPRDPRFDHRVHCVNSGCPVNPRGPLETKRHEAAGAWNRRENGHAEILAERDAARAEVERLREIISRIDDECDARQVSGGYIRALCTQVDALPNAEDDRGSKPPVDPLVGQWTKTVPSEQARYWHWNGHEDSEPVPLHVLYSGTTGKHFVARGQMGIEHAIDCDDFGGWWMRMTVPPIPAGEPDEP